MKQFQYALLFLIMCAFPVLATTEETVETTNQAATGQMDLLPQNDKDTFGPVSATDPHDIAYDPAEKIWTIYFWVDPLNGSWIGDANEPAGLPPYRVFVGGLPEGSCKFDKRMAMPEAKPLLTNPDGTTSADNITWVLRFKKFGEIRFTLFIISADNKHAAGNIVMASPAFFGGQKCGYKMVFHENGTVTVPTE